MTSTLDEQIHRTDTEVRFAPIEFRDSGSELVIEGWPILFNSEGQVFDGMGKRGFFIEIIKPGALDNADFSDCVLVPNHARNAELPLAATYNGTLKADIKNPKGVKMRATVDPTRHDVQDTVKAIRSGLMPQMSFAWPTNDNGFRDSWDAAHEVRTIHSIGTILDFSVVPRGAYSQTSLKVKQRSAARVMSMFPDETRFLLWCASEQRKGAKISAENKGKLGQVLGHLQAAQVHVGDLLSLNGEDPNSFVTLTGSQQDGSYNQKLWMRDLLKGATYPPS